MSEVGAAPVSIDDLAISTFREARLAATQAELGGHEEAGTFPVGTVLEGMNVISAKWVFVWKTDAGEQTVYTPSVSDFVEGYRDGAVRGRSMFLEDMERKKCACDVGRPMWMAAYRYSGRDSLDQLVREAHADLDESGR